MKASREFPVITIVIESEEEAERLWMLLNLSEASVKEACRASRSEYVAPINGEEQKMWEDFDIVFTPIGE